MTNQEILEALEAAIKQEKAFYIGNENLKLTPEEAEKEYQLVLGTIVHCGLHIFGGFTKEYDEIKKLAYGENQLTFEEYLISMSKESEG